MISLSLWFWLWPSSLSPRTTIGPRPLHGSSSEHPRGEFGRQRQDGRQEHRAAYVYGAVAKVIVARAAVFDAYVGWRVDGARAVVVSAVRGPRARSDYHHFSVHCNKTNDKSIEKLFISQLHVRTYVRI